MTEWTKEKEKKVLWKYRFHLTARVIRVVVILLFLYWLYSIFLTIGYDRSTLDDKHKFQINVAMDWTQAGIHGEYGLNPSTAITPFLSQKIDIPMYRTVGKEEQAIGELHVTKRLLTGISSKETTYYQQSNNKRFGFALPEDPRTGEKLSTSTYGDDAAFESLEMVHEGTVADLAFSTDQFYKPEELLKKLEKYDVNVIWMPLYAGELKEFDVAWSSAGGGQNMAVDTLGLTRAVEMDRNDYRSYKTVMLDTKTVKENQKIMLENMKYLLENESDIYLEHILGLWKLEERYNYLKENEFLVYGAVVTGPVKELLKLKEEPGFRNIQVGEFEYWNWTE